MPNEVELIITATDATKPTQDGLKQSWTQFEKSMPPIGIKATNPINDAFMAQVKSSIRSLSNQSLEIPVEPDTSAFREQLDAQIQELAQVTKLDIPLEEANAAEFRAQVLEQVSAISEQARVVVTVDADEGSLANARASILEAADASKQEVQAQQDLNDALAKNNAQDIAKAEAALASASKEASDAAGYQATAMAAAAEAEAAVGEGAEVAAVGMRGLDAVMGPLWGVMNVAQIAMFAMYSTSSSTATAVQDLSQQLIGLGKSGANAASTLTGNAGLQNLNTDFQRIGSSAAAFSQAFSGSIQLAKGYVDNLTTSQKTLGNQVVVTSQQLISGTSGGKAAGESMSATLKTTSATIQQLTQDVNNHKIAEGQLPQAVQASIDKYNAYTDIIGQAKKAYADEQAALAVVTADLQQQGIVLSSAQQGWNSIGGAVSNTVSEFNTATAGVKSLADATVAAAAANQAAQAQFTQLQQAVTTTGQALVSADHSIVTAHQGVDAAQQSYVNALQQEVTAQQAVANARAAAAQNLINLQLQTNDAAAGTLNSGVNLFDATTAAAALGVNTSNAHAVASQQVTAQNEAQVKAAIALIVAENQLADSQNSAAQTQSSLNTARSQGIDGNTSVVSSNQALTNASNQVKTAQIAEQNAQFAVTQAQQAARQAAEAHTQALNANSTSTDITTAAGNRNWQMLEQLFEKNLSATGSVEQATSWTEQEGEKMGFTAGQIDGMIAEVTRIPPITNFSIVGTPSLNLATLLQQAQAQGISPYSLGIQTDVVDNALGGTHYATGGAIGGAGGPTADDQLIWASTGEHMWTADEVQAAGGHGAVEALRRSVKGYASGGAIQQAMGLNMRLAGWDGVLQGVSYALDTFGAHAPNLPKDTGKVDFGGLGVPAGGGSGAVPAVPSSRSANEAIVQSVFASMFGWNSPAEWAATVQLLMQESGFNNTAQNPTSTAYGMFQFLNSTWAGYGIPKTSDPTQQTIAGGRYIRARYGDPVGAENHERAFHWFAGGGPASGWAGIGDAGPEAVRLPNGSTVLPAANTAALTGQAPATGNLTMTFAGAVNNGFATLIMQLVRTGQIQLSVNGTPVRAG